MAVILNVCAANRCRSPLAQLFLQAALGAPEGSPVVVASAGTWTRGGEPIWPAAGEEATRRGLLVDGFSSRQITPAMVQEADLVLAATRGLRDEVVTLVPAALRKTFTWRELAWLLSGSTPEDLPPGSLSARVEALAALAVSRRGHLVPPPGQDLDVADPVGGPPEALPAAADVILEAVLTVSEILLPPPSGRHRRSGEVRDSR